MKNLRKSTVLRSLVLGIMGILQIVVFKLNLCIAAEEEDKEYNFNWLDPDKKIYVLQNRRYQKKGKLFATMMGGLGLSGPYVNTYNLDPRVGFYFLEEWGVEFFYSFSFNSRSSTFDALVQSGTTTIPRVRELSNLVGGVVHFAPWYAKINVFNSIMYFDWYFEGGAGMVQSDLDLNTTPNGTSTFESQSFFALFLGTGHQFHLDERFFIRIDFMGTYYRAPLLGNQGDDSWFSNYNLNLGLGVRL